jgi:hypothetical protein
VDEQALAKGIGVLALVGQQALRQPVPRRHKLVHACDVVRFASGQRKGKRASFGIGADVDLGREPTPRAPERLICVPLFAPAAWA